MYRFISIKVLVVLLACTCSLGWAWNKKESIFAKRAVGVGAFDKGMIYYKGSPVSIIGKEICKKLCQIRRIKNSLISIKTLARPFFRYNQGMRKWMIGVVICFLAACASDQKSGIVGNDRDGHGCIGSAGYTWSAVRRQCVRMWEVGLPLYHVRAALTSAAFIVPSEDWEQVEVILPVQKRNSYLVRSKTDKNVWEAPDSFLKVVHTPAHDQEEEKWEIFEDGVLYYRSRVNTPD